VEQEPVLVFVQLALGTQTVEQVVDPPLDTPPQAVAELGIALQTVLCEVDEAPQLAGHATLVHCLVTVSSQQHPNVILVALRAEQLTSLQLPSPQVQFQ
jgi:hypothetical protein